MLESAALALVGKTVLAEGIKFLFGQAAEVLKRWRARKDEAPGEPSEAITTAPPPAGVFDGPSEPLAVDPDAMARLEGNLLTLRGALANYADGIEPIDPGNEQMLQAVDALRQVMEAIHQRRLTFKGEGRDPAGTRVEGAIDVDIVAGHAAAVEARLIKSGWITGTATAKHLESGASLHGVKGDQIGE